MASLAVGLGGRVAVEALHAARPQPDRPIEIADGDLRRVKALRLGGKRHVPRAQRRLIAGISAGRHGTRPPSCAVFPKPLDEDALVFALKGVVNHGSPPA